MLCSGCAATWAHHAIVHENDQKGLKNGLIIAIALGALFTVFQVYEYSHAAFGFAGNIYGANFFMATGFHGFEAAAWYWHFVDVVWLFLFAAVYIWGG